MNKRQPVELPSITSGFDEIYAEVKMAPETCQRVENIMINQMTIFGIYICIQENVYLHNLYVFNEAGQQVETGKAADENQRFGQIIYNR